MGLLELTLRTLWANDNHFFFIFLENRIQVWQYFFVEIDHEIFSGVFLSLPLNQDFLEKEFAQVQVNS